MLINRTKDVTVAERLMVADTPLARLKGLLGRSSLAHDEALWIRPCSSIHTWFMLFPIDAVFVDRELVVTAVYPALGPWRMTMPRRGTVSVFELAAGSAERGRIDKGDQLEVVRPT